MEEKGKSPKTRNSGKWTNAQFRKFVIRCLRRAKWPVKFEVLDEAFQETQINPNTGRKRKMYLCRECGKLHPSGSIQIDHIVPVLGEEGLTWNEIVERMFVEKDGLQALCEDCHELKSLCDQFKVNMEEAAKIRSIRRFKNMAAKDQVKTLSQLNITGATNARQRIEKYSQHIQEQ